MNRNSGFHDRVLLEIQYPSEAGLSPSKVDDLVTWISNRTPCHFPGAVILVARHGKIVIHKAFGFLESGKDEPMQLDSLFDLESISKVVATSTLALVLSENGKLPLDAAVSRYLPAYCEGSKRFVRVRDLLSYSAGLDDLDLAFDFQSSEEAWERMLAAPLHYTPGTSVKYSDLTYRILGRVLEKAGDDTLDHLCKRFIWSPLGMNDTCFNPPTRLKTRIAGNGRMRGRVEDDQDHALGGVVGCDGVFSTAKDLAIFCQSFLNGGMYLDFRLLSETAVKVMSSNQTPWASSSSTDTDRMSNLLYTPKGYGWELMTPSFSPGGNRLSKSSYGKAGGGGSFLWIDPEKDLFGIYLTNHGLPTPFDETGWNVLLDKVAPNEFFDRTAEAVIQE